MVSKPHAPKRALPITNPRELRVALAGLDARERRILELRYGIGEARLQTLSQIGRRFGISGERVRQLEARALTRLAETNGTATKRVDAPKRISPEQHLPRTALQALTLVLLRSQPAHGYDLLRRLEPPGVERLGPRLYRLLRELEQRGLVRSDWAGSTAGPERRVYRLTRKGDRQLQDDAQVLNRLSDTLQRFFEHYAQAPG